MLTGWHVIFFFDDGFDPQLAQIMFQALLQLWLCVFSPLRENRERFNKIFIVFILILFFLRILHYPQRNGLRSVVNDGLVEVELASEFDHVLVLTCLQKLRNDPGYRIALLVDDHVHAEGGCVDKLRVSVLQVLLDDVSECESFFVVLQLVQEVLVNSLPFLSLFALEFVVVNILKVHLVQTGCLFLVDQEAILAQSV